MMPKNIKQSKLPWRASKLVAIVTAVTFALLVVAYVTATPGGEMTNNIIETTEKRIRPNARYTKSRINIDQVAFAPIQTKTRKDLKMSGNVSVNLNHKLRHPNSKVNKGITEARTVADIQDDRTAMFLNRCHDDAVAASHRLVTKAMHMLYLPRYHLSVKFIPKIGSTFMSQMFRILISRESDNDLEIFNVSRSEIHHVHYRPYSRVFNSETIREVTPVIFARNPFSRLFSAFIDKVYLLNSLSLAANVYRFAHRKDNEHTKCVLDVTFKDFLTYVLHCTRPLLNDHYMPTTKMISLPVICNADNVVIVKQASFASDIEFVLQKVHVCPQKQNIIKQALREKRAETTITSIVKTAFTKHKAVMSKHRLRCVTWLKLIQRLWNSFIIQGHVHEGCRFPMGEFRTLEEQSDVHRFLKIILQAARETPVTADQRRYQRKKALVTAFEEVEQSEIDILYVRYNLDFLLFDYDKSVPTM